ncbi:MAG: class II glutamine amidotransferase [Thermaerobacter sp.]|nr:class II glutamine amidotransferase [Thermaerobacter sp.]
MCRLMGLVSRTPTTLPDVLGERWASFVDLSRHHSDGWGLAWLDAGNSLRILRETGPAWSSPVFQQAVMTPARAWLLHFRWATPGMPVTMANTHPFEWPERQLAFAHNGTVSPAAALTELTADRFKTRRQGTTDSEQYFWAWASAEATTPGQGFARLLRRFRRAPFTYSGLNTLVLSAGGLEILSAYNPQAPFAQADPSYYHLHAQQSPDRFVVASSHWEVPGDWTLLAPPQVVRVGSDLTVTATRL